MFVMLPRIPEWHVALLGLIKLGAVPMPGTSLLTGRDIAFRVQRVVSSAEQFHVVCRGLSTSSERDAVMKLEKPAPPR